jgi:hypothetical protein
MTDADKQKLKRNWTILAAYFQKEIPDIVLNLYVEDMAGYKIEDILRAMTECRLEKGRRTMPLPADIIEKINPEVSDSSNANQAASLIRSAISKFGPMDTDRAKAYCGELAWSVVDKMGGWSYLCTTLTNDDMNTFYAQARELAKSQIELAKAGRLGTPPQLPHKNKPEPGLQSLGSLLKQIEEKRSGTDNTGEH